MSAPETNLEKQRWRHRGPLIGMILAVGFAVAFMFNWLFKETEDAQGPGSVPIQSDSTGSVGPADDASMPDAVDPQAPNVPTPVVPEPPVPAN